jgi:hypothetical protein
MLIYLQLLLLLSSSVGWMYWLNLWTSNGRWSWPRSVVLFGAGFAAQIILLQNLTYLDNPIQSSFLLPFVIGIIGLWRFVAAWQSQGFVEQSFRKNSIYAGAVFLGVFSLQSISALMAGPSNYYGKGHIDHLNYAFISEYLRTEPFSMPEADMQKQAWLVKASQQRNNRIGQSVAQAYTASLSFVSAKEAYGGLCSFFLGLLAVALFVLAQSFSLSRPYCILAACWVGLAPATTRIHLEGFLSQTATLFVFPLFILWARLNHESIRFKIVSGGILVSYLLVSYTEYFVIGLFLLFLLTLASTVTWSRRQLAISTATVSLGLFLVPAYLPRAYRFALEQYSYAAGLSQAVEVLAPDGGTVYGWARALIQIPPFPQPLERPATVAAGCLLLGLCACGLFSRSRRNRLFLAASTLTPLVFLGVLLSAQVLAKYPFQKICDSFAFLWILLAMRGISLLAIVARRTWGEVAPSLAAIAPGLFLLFALFGFAAQHRLVAMQFSSLAVVGKREFKDTLRYVREHPERSVVIRHEHPLAVGWIAYEARASRVYIVSAGLSDIPLAPGSHVFSKVPESLERATFVTINGYRDETTSEGVPNIEIDNPQGQDGLGGEHWYWLGDAMNVDIFRWSGESPQEYELTFRGQAGPAHPSPMRTLRLTNLRTGQEETLRFTGEAKLSVAVVLVRGKNTFRLESVEPLEHVNRIANDPRKHLSRLDRFALGKPKSVHADDPRLSQMNSRDSTPLPLLVPHNPQREDRLGDASWYWIGREMELEVNRGDASKQNFVYELEFDVQAGPANPDPKRKIRIRNLFDKRATEYEFIGTGKATAVFTAAPGVTRLAIEVVSPTEQKVHIPNDPRNHMVRASDFKVKLIRGNAAPATPAKKAPALAGR